MKRLFRLQYNAPVTLTFALISLLALLLGKLTNGWTDTYLFSVWHSSLSDILTYPRFFLHVLGHVDYDHYIGNMMMILVVGPGLEEKYGSRNLLSAIVITALVSGLVYWFLFPGSMLMGASGIVFMMIVMGLACRNARRMHTHNAHPCARSLPRQRGGRRYNAQG